MTPAALLPRALLRGALLPRALLPITLLCAGLAQAGTVFVHFDQPERYSDVGPRHDADAVQQSLASHLQALGSQQLPAGQTLTLTITDIDLAGEIRPSARRLHGVRVLGGSADWPRISLRYSLADGTRVLTEGSDTLADMAYLMRSTSQRQHNSRLPYEQRMLGDWFTKRFGAVPAH